MSVSRKTHRWRQNIQIRITATEPLVRKILAAVDWAPLQQVLAK